MLKELSKTRNLKGRHEEQTEGSSGQSRRGTGMARRADSKQIHDMRILRAGGGNGQGLS